MSDVSQGFSPPWRRTVEQLEAGIARWAEAVRGATVSDVRAPQSGMANDTVFFVLDGEPLVARLAPAPESPYPTFPEFDLEMQHRVIELVRERTDVPVPVVVHYEASPEWLDVPFLVTRVVEGEVAADNPPYLLDPGGWFLQGGPEQWQRLERSTVDVLARLHRISDEDEVTAFLRPATTGDTPLHRQLSYLRFYYDWAREHRRVPILERAIDVLAATLPDNRRSVLLWGDSRPGNIIYRDFEPAAVLDWEMATVGPPELDVAWATFFHQFFSSMAATYGIEVPAMFDRAQVAAAYEAAGGEPLDDLAWYEALAGLRFGIILLRMSLRSMAFGLQEEPAEPDDLIMFAPLLTRLLDDLAL